jgi:hypothetical protein
LKTRTKQGIFKFRQYCVQASVGVQVLCFNRIWSVEKSKKRTMIENEDDLIEEQNGWPEAAESDPTRTFAVNPQADGSGGEEDEDVVMTSTSSANAVYAHARADCSIHLFGHAPAQLFCEMCYCFVCDEPAKDCTQWLSHCQAKPNEKYWVDKRAQAKIDREQAKEQAEAYAQFSTSTPNSGQCQHCTQVSATEHEFSYIGRLVMDATITPGARTTLQSINISRRPDYNSFRCDHSRRCNTELLGRKITLGNLNYHISRNWLVMMGSEPTNLEKGARIKVPKAGTASGFHKSNETSVEKVDNETWDIHVNIGKTTKRQKNAKELVQVRAGYPQYAGRPLPPWATETSDYTTFKKVVQFNTLPTSYSNGRSTTKTAEQEMLTFLQDNMSHVFQLDVSVILADEPLPPAPGSEGVTTPGSSGSSVSGGGSGDSSGGSSGGGSSAQIMPPRTRQQAKVIVNVKANPDKCIIGGRNEKANGFHHDAKIAQLLLMLRDKPPLAPEDSSWRPLAEQLLAMAEVSSSLQPEGKSKTLDGLLHDLETATPKMGFGPQNRLSSRVATTASNLRPESQIASPVYKESVVATDGAVSAASGGAGGAKKKSRPGGRSNGAKAGGKAGEKVATPRPKRAKRSELYTSDGFSDDMVIQPSSKKSKSPYINKRIAGLEGMTVGQALNGFTYEDKLKSSEVAAAEAAASTSFSSSASSSAYAGTIADSTCERVYRYGDFKYDISSGYLLDPRSWEVVAEVHRKKAEEKAAIELENMQMTEAEAGAGTVKAATAPIAPAAPVAATLTPALRPKRTALATAGANSTPIATAVKARTLDVELLEAGSAAAVSAAISAADDEDDDWVPEAASGGGTNSLRSSGRSSGRRSRGSSGQNAIDVANSGDVDGDDAPVLCVAPSSTGLCVAPSSTGMTRSSRSTRASRVAQRTANQAAGETSNSGSGKGYGKGVNAPKGTKRKIGTPKVGTPIVAEDMVSLPEGEVGYWLKGLTVPLRTYQYEALLWMLHEETANNGMLRCFWSPFRCADGRRFFYSPLQGLAKDACSSFGATVLNSRGLQPLPPMTRGCLLAEQMGLGKTIETVALILCNPRSAQGVGKQVSEHTMATSLTIEQQEQRDEELARTAAAAAAAAAVSSSGSSSGSSANGSAGGSSGGATGATNAPVELHKPLAKWHGGTLVVCMVSLVGQWIDEIRSKLSGDAACSIQCYHGSNRKKNPSLLSQHDVVVTTYSILQRERKDGTEKATQAAETVDWSCDSMLIPSCATADMMEPGRPIMARRFDHLNDSWQKATIERKHPSNEMHWLIKIPGDKMNGGDQVSRLLVRQLNQIHLHCTCAYLPLPLSTLLNRTTSLSQSISRS